MKTRFWEIDSLRGLAILMMISFHFLYDLNFFGNYNFNLHSGFWWLFARITAAIFILLVGISLTISYSRTKAPFTKYLKRGLKIFSWGLLITIATFIFLRNGFIIFGVLHFIGIAIIIAYPLIRLRIRNLILGIFFILIGIYLSAFTFNFPYLLWLGLTPASFYTFDYFPILPWFGVILIGIFLGNKLYPNAKRSFNIIDLSKLRIIKLLSFLGRHSLFIYLLHQPVLIALLYLFVL